VIPPSRRRVDNRLDPTNGGEMTTEDRAGPDIEPVSGWAVGGMAFAATVMTMVGVFQVVVGLAAIFDDNFFVVARHYTFNLDTTAFGWVHLIIGVLMVGAGFSLFGRKAYGAVMVLFLASISAIANFFFIPYYPFWAIVVIALDVWVIWSVTRPGALRV
jgi:hypothetical protein